MFDRNRGGAWGRRGTHPLRAGRPPRRESRPHVETLEGRQLLAASLAPIGNITVPALQGYQVPLNGGTGPRQTYSVTSSNPDVQATVAQGKFLTLNVTHTAASASDVSFSGPLTFQL